MGRPAERAAAAASLTAPSSATVLFLDTVSASASAWDEAEAEACVGGDGHFEPAPICDDQLLAVEAN